jgi:hypothetical protein
MIAGPPLTWTRGFSLEAILPEVHDLFRGRSY